MTPKEKAQELFDEYRPLSWGNTMFTRIERIKKCAMIVSDEAMEALKSIIGHEPYQWTISEKETIEFWQQVKQEISNL